VAPVLLRGGEGGHEARGAAADARVGVAHQLQHARQHAHADRVHLVLRRLEGEQRCEREHRSALALQV